VTPGPGHRKCTPYLWPGPGDAPLALPLTEGLGLSAVRHICGSRHGGPDGLANRNSFGIEAVKAVNVDAQIVRGDPLSMERIDSADPAEEVSCCPGVKLVLGERVVSGQELELALMHLDHECILLLANRTVAHGQFVEVRLDFESDRAAVACALVGLKWTRLHRRAVSEA